MTAATTTPKAKQSKSKTRTVPRITDATDRNRDEADVQFIKAKLNDAELNAGKADEFTRKSLQASIEAGERLAKKFAETEQRGHPYYRRWGEWCDENGIKQQRENECRRLWEGRDKLPLGGTFSLKEALKIIAEVKAAQKDAKKTTTEQPTATVTPVVISDTKPPETTEKPNATDNTELPTTNEQKPGTATDDATKGAGEWKPFVDEVYGFTPVGSAGAKMPQIEVEVLSVNETNKTAVIRSLDEPRQVWPEIAWDRLGVHDPRANPAMEKEQAKDHSKQTKEFKLVLTVEKHKKYTEYLKFLMKKWALGSIHDAGYAAAERFYLGESGAFGEEGGNADEA